jgi:hypothetical protein
LHSGVLIIGSSLAMNTIRPFLQKRHFAALAHFSSLAKTSVDIVIGKGNNW